MDDYTCDSCTYFSAIPQQPGNGVCRFNPPVPIATPQGPVAFWPNVAGEHDWCSWHEVGSQRPIPDMSKPTPSAVLLDGVTADAVTQLNRAQRRRPSRATTRRGRRTWPAVTVDMWCGKWSKGTQERPEVVDVS